MLNKLELEIWSEPSLFFGALIWNSIPLSIKTLKKNKFKSELNGKLFEILEKRDDYIRVCYYSTILKIITLCSSGMTYSQPSCLTQAVNHTTN